MTIFVSKLVGFFWFRELTPFEVKVSKILFEEIPIFVRPRQRQTDRQTDYRHESQEAGKTILYFYGLLLHSLVTNRKPPKVPPGRRVVGHGGPWRYFKVP